MNRAGKIIVTVGAVAGLTIAGVALAKSSGGSGGGKPKPGDPGFDDYDPGTDGPSVPGGGGGGGDVPGGNVPGGGSGGNPTRVLPGNGAFVFGNISNGGIPGDFDGGANTVRFSTDCAVVLVGRQFWKMGTFGTASGGPDYQSCEQHSDLKTCIRTGQNVCCFIDYLMDQQGITSAREIGVLILDGLEPPCRNTAPSSWPPAMRNFVEWLRIHVNEYVGESSGQMDWN